MISRRTFLVGVGASVAALVAGIPAVVAGIPKLPRAGEHICALNTDFCVRCGATGLEIVEGNLACRPTLASVVFATLRKRPGIMDNVVEHNALLARLKKTNKP